MSAPSLHVPLLVGDTAAPAGRLSSDFPDASRRTVDGVKLDVDFSLAIHNRTGKYFIGVDVLEVAADRLGSVYFGSVPLERPPVGLAGQILGRLQLWQVRGQTRGTWPRIPRRPRGPTPLLHLDPFTVATVPLRRSDAVLCHDVGPLTHPELFDQGVGAIYRAVYEEIASAGPHVIFVSRASQTAFSEIFPDARLASSRVIYPALRKAIATDGVRPPWVEIAPFLLTVGSIGARKNQARCIKAFARTGLAARGVRYVLCGGREPGFEEVEALAAETPGVVLRPYIEDAELAWLYGNAHGFVLASLLEGFGIPVAEAIGRGLVPLVSRGGVLAEVAGPAAIAADPKSEDEIASGMRDLCLMGNYERVERLGRLAASLNRFRWDVFERDWSCLIGEMLDKRDV